MSVYKEIGYLVRKIQDNSRQIWNDSCDYGMVVKTLNDPIINEIRDIYLPMCDNNVATLKYDTGAKQIIEFNGGYPAVIEAGFEKCRLEFIQVKNNKNLIGYIYVEPTISNDAKQRAKEYDA